MKFMVKEPPVKFVWKGNHHAYYGIFFIVFGAFNWYMGTGNSNLEGLIPFWQALVGTGSYMIVDDVIEHKITANTPLRIIYRKLFKIKQE